MIRYANGTEVRVGDRIRHATALASVEEVIEGQDVARWGLEAPGFMILCDQCGRVFIEPGSYDWADVKPIGTPA